MTEAAEATRTDSRTASVTKRSLDHFVVSVGNLDTSAGLYRRMGFRVLPIMEHVEIGTSNVIVQFHDTYLELIGDIDHCRVPEITERMGIWQALGDVFWMASLTSSGLEAERPKLEAAGLPAEPIRNAQRRVRLPEGGWIDTDSRSMYIWNRNSLLTSLFMSDHRKPEAIWVPGYMLHPNGAIRVSGLRYMAADPVADVDYYTTLFGAPPAEVSADGIRFVTPRGEFFEILTETKCRAVLPGVGPLEPGIAGRGAGMSVLVESLDRCRWSLRDGGVPFVEHEGSLVVGPAHACGVAFEFHQQ